MAQAPDSPTKPLSQRQQEVLDAYLANDGDIEATANAVQSSKSNVYSILGRKNVSEQLVGQAREHLRINALAAAKSVTRLSQHARSELVMLNAATVVLDKSGVSDDADSNAAGLAIQINL